MCAQIDAYDSHAMRAGARLITPPGGTPTGGPADGIHLGGQDAPYPASCFRARTYRTDLSSSDTMFGTVELPGLCSPQAGKEDKHSVTEAEKQGGASTVRRCAPACCEPSHGVGERERGLIGRPLPDSPELKM